MNLSEVTTELDGTVIQVSVLVDSIREYKSKRGTMAFIEVTDEHSTIELVAFAKLYQEYKPLLFSGDELLITARVQVGYDINEDNEDEVVKDEVVYIKLILENLTVVEDG